MSDEAGILQTNRDVCVYIINLVATPRRLSGLRISDTCAIGVFIIGVLLDLVIFPDHCYGTILILFVTGMVFEFWLGMLMVYDFREWRKQQRGAGR